MVFPLDPFNTNTYLPATPTIPLALLVVAVTNSFPMQVTAQIPNLDILPTPANTYISGQLVRFSIPSSYGMFQLNGLTGKILNIIGLVFYIDIDSTNFDVFTLPAPFQEQPATFAPAGSRNLTFDNTTTFEAFQSGTNTGN